MIIQALFQPAQTLEDLARELNMDINCILAIQQARYPNSRPPVFKSGSLHLAWKWVPRRVQLTTTALWICCESLQRYFKLF